MTVRRRASLLTPLIFISLGSAAALAEEPDYAGMLLHNQSLLSSTPKTCDDKNASLNNVELQQCSAAALRAADHAMNEAYAAALKAGDDKRNGTLRQAQRQWLAFRNLHCDWAYHQYQGGSLAPVIMGQCLVDVTKERTRQLKAGIEN